MEESASDISDSDADPDKILSKINQVSGNKDQESEAEDWGAFAEEDQANEPE